MSALEQEAMRNMMTRFEDNPCRGVVVGMDEFGNGIQLAWIQGRSDNSRNRVYEVDATDVRTAPHDASKVEDPRLIIYQAMGIARRGMVHVVSNGDQTNTLIDILDTETGSPLFRLVQQALLGRNCEPDAPNFTARITGAFYVGAKEADLALLSRDPFATERWLETIAQHGLTVEQFQEADISRREATQHFNREVGKIAGLDHERFPTKYDFWQLPLAPGFGYCLTTYAPGHETLPPFVGEPFLVPIRGTATEVMDGFWRQFNPEWRVAIVAKEITPNMPSKIYEPLSRFA